MSEEIIKEDEQDRVSEKIDEAQLALEYMNKDKEKLKLNKNDFNKISYVSYEDIFKKLKPELDFLYDYSKILGPENNDPKTIQWQLSNLDRLFKYGIDISVLKKRNKEQSSGHFKMSNVLENISYRLQKHGRLAPMIDIARDLPKRSEEEQIQINEEEEDEEDINIENEDINNGESQSDNFKKVEEKNINKEAQLNMNNNNSSVNDINNIINTDKINLDNNINPINLIDNNNVNLLNINLNKDKKTNNPNGYNGYEDNFYDKNDPFIDDELDNTSEENDLLYKLSLEPGNYSEQEILSNLKKNLKKLSRSTVKKKKKMKNIKGKKEKEKDKEKEKEKGKKSAKKLKLPNKLLNNKTKRKNNEEKDSSKKKKKISIDSLEELNLEKIKNIFGQMISEYDSEINTDHEKESFMRRNIKIIEDIYKKNEKDFIIVLSEKFQISIDKAKTFIEYELFKSVLENKYSNFSKFLNKLYTLLKENGVLEITSLSELKKYMASVPEIEKSLNHVMDNILCYRDKFNFYMGKHYLDMSQINEALECFIPNIRERNNEYIIKMSSKFNEYEEKFKIIIPKEFIVSYIQEKNPEVDFTEDLNTDINNRRFSLESFIFYNIGIKTPVYLQSDEKGNINENENLNGGNIKDYENFVVELDKNEILSVKKNDVYLKSINPIKEELTNENLNNNINNNNNTNNDGKIFQSVKNYENRILNQKLFISKISLDDNNINQVIQNDGKQ